MQPAASPRPSAPDEGRSRDAQRLLAQPPLRAILHLAVPTTAVMVLGATSGVLHTYFVSRLGADAIAAVSLVFPVSLIMMTMMGGGVGAGVSTAIAQSLGGGRREAAESVAEHALLITVALSASFTLGLTVGAPALFRLMGGRGEVLAGATLFARVLFGGSLVTFLVSTFDSILRGEGNVRVPSTWATVSLTLQIALTPIFMFALGMGLAGAAVATLSGQLIGSIPRARYIFSGRGAVRPRILPARLSLQPVSEILRVGIPATLATLANYLGLMLVTATVAHYGTKEIAAFGLGTRLDFLVITLAFGVGSAVLTLVGLARGAGDLQRVRAVVARALWLAATLLAGVAGFLVWRPGAWLGLFSTDPAILRVGASYLRTVGPSYPFVGASMIVSFALQGIGRAVIPLALMAGRTAFVVAGALALSSAGAPVGSIFALMAAGNVAMTLVLFWRFRALVAGRS